MQILTLTEQLAPRLEDFLQQLLAKDPHSFFSPHGSDITTLIRIAQNIRKDIYVLGILDDKVLVYGLLRGWDEGYSIPSLGLAVAPEARGLGLGRAMMYWLHSSAAARGAAQVRLRVASQNISARSLYDSLGYEFCLDEQHTDYLVGHVILKAKS